MSNQRTPKDTRHIRRGDKNPSRGTFVESNDSKKENNLVNKIKNIFKKDNNIEPETNGRRSQNNPNQSRDVLARNAFKPIHGFKTDANVETEKRKSRNLHKLKTILLYGLPLAIIITFLVFGISAIAKNKDKEVESQDILNESNKVTIYVDGNVLEVFTEAETVGKLFEDNDIVLATSQKSSYAEDDVVVDNMEIFISSPMSVSIVQNGIINSVTIYGGRVSDVFIAMEIDLDDYDIVEPDVDAIVYDQMKIDFIDVEIKQVTIVEDVPYETEEGETSTVESGYYHLEQDGEVGATEITYEVKLVDGVEESRKEIGREIVQEPKNRVILWGTATPSNRSSDNLSSSNDSTDDTTYDETTVNNPGEQATNPSVPGAPSNYIETMSGHVTAYTHTGSTTATGTWPRSTRTLENPGTCAVVSSTIPYGSLLYVTGYGYCIAEDTGAFRSNPDRWNQIDLFMNTREECIIWGRRYEVTVYILRKGY